MEPHNTNLIFKLREFWVLTELTVGSTAEGIDQLLQQKNTFQEPKDVSSWRVICLNKTQSYEV